MAALEKILVVDDNEINRSILAKILDGDYEVIYAENGVEAFAQLERHKAQIAGILLDLVMPVMDGFTFLDLFVTIDEYSNLPVIVTTGQNDKESELNALEHGAWDFVSKPYEPQILRFRLQNALTRSQLSAYTQLKYLAEYDTLTGIYNKSKFFEETHEMLEQTSLEAFSFFRLDIDKFSLINSFFGNSVGDDILKYTASIIKEFVSSYEVYKYGRIETDVFAFCIPTTDVAEMEKIVFQIKDALHDYNLKFNINATFGIYIIHDRTLPIDRILDCANLAAKEVKGNFVKSYAIYCSSMRRELEEEQEIVNDMSYALENEQFLVYFQPKYGVVSQRVVGAEALVRWNHPEKGMISPVKFIPVFEKNGFITKLDYYVWDKVCSLLHEWEEKNIPLLPVSVNVSRVNLYDPKFLERLCDLTDKYGISRSLLNLEITESVYVDNTEVIESVIARLHEEGFLVLMDDFGSGFSSLNVLKNIDIDILKIDMRLFDETGIKGRGENIVASVVCMANWLDIPTIAEGVEKKEQVEFLKYIGCDYIQGFYFARPMPVQDYLQLILDSD